MELVSANTRNFLFLTISQYNEQQKDVRARVSMRRDQPFWEGGNSFIACESFRISAAPSPGGLFYSQIPPDFAIGARIDTSPEDEKWNPADNDNPPTLLQHTDPLAAGRSGDGLELHDPRTVRYGTGYQLAGKLRLGLDADKIENRTNDLLERYSRYCNPNGLTRGSLVKLVGTKKDAGETVTATWAKGYLDRAPSHLITGNGAGPSNLWSPRVEFMYAPALLATMRAANVGDPFQIHIVVYNEGKVDQVTFTKLLREVISCGTAGIECNNRAPTVPETPRFVAPACLGQFVKLRGPADIVMQTSALFNGEFLKEICHWNPPLARRTKLHGADGKHDKLVSIGAGWMAPHGENGIQLQLCAQLSIAGKNAVGTTANPNAIFTTDVLEGEFSLITSVKNTHLMVGCPVNFTLKDWEGKTAAADSADPTAAERQFSATIKKMYLHPTGTHQLNIMRHADKLNTKTVYTPNELFRIFNEDDLGTKVPWSLSTDANGGFVVKWNPKDDKVFSSLLISKTMKEQLGLLDYMTYKATIGGGDAVTNDFVVISQIDEFAADSFTSGFSTVLADQLYGEETLAAHFDFTTALADANHGYGTDAWLVDGTKVRVMRVYKKAVEDEESHEIRVYGDEIEEDGVVFYQFHNLPPIARLGNTSEVSVESFSTYSQIDLVIPNLPFQPMLGSNTDNRILASLRLPFEYGTNNDSTGAVSTTNFSYYGDLLYNSDSSRSYLRITTDQQLYDCDVEARLIKRNGEMERMKIPFKGQFQVKLRFLQTQ